MRRNRLENAMNTTDARSPKALEAWLDRAKPGEIAVYYEGFLLHDRRMTITSSDGTSVSLRQEPANTLGNIAWSAYRTGRVLLTQYKLGAGKYLYLATRTNTRRA